MLSVQTAESQNLRSSKPENLRISETQDLEFSQDKGEGATRTPASSRTCRAYQIAQNVDD